MISGALLAALVAAAPAPAATISPSGVRFPQVAVNADGVTLVAWERKSAGTFALEARVGRSPLRLGPTRRLSAKGFNARVAVGADGTAAIVWAAEGARRAGTLYAAVARPGQRLGRAQVVVSGRARIGPVGVAVQPDGRVVAVYARNDKLGFALAPRGRAFGRPRNLATLGPSTAGTVVLDPRDGAVLVAYGAPLSLTPPANQQAAARTLSPTAPRFSPPVVLSTREAGATALDEAHPVAVSGSGGAGVAYTRMGGSHSPNLARRAADGSWATPERIAVAAYGADAFPGNLRATLLTDGSAVAAWSITTYQPGGLGGVVSSQVVGSSAAPGSPFGPAQLLTPADQTYGPPSVAAAGGEAFVAAARPHGPILLAAKAAGASTFRTPRTLARNGDGDVLLAAGGRHVLAVFQRQDRLRMTVVR